MSGEVEAICEQVASGERFLLTTHEGPDGDALGSLLGMHHLLTQLGKDSVMFLSAKEFPLPVEYRFLALEEVFHEPPADVEARTLVFLDCGNIDRMPVDFLRREGANVLNIDHHHDNTRFGTINLVDVEACCTAEIVFELVRRLGADLTPEIAEALYVGLVTDTGRFSYENADAEAHRMAAELIDAGVDVPEIYRRLYERVPLEKVRLTARALEKIELVAGGVVGLAYVSEQDYAAAGASDELTEGIIDHVRAIEGVAVAALVRDRLVGDRGARKASLRASDDRVDVSAIAREQGGGGHRRAAGFSTEMEYPELRDWLVTQVESQLGS